MKVFTEPLKWLIYSVGFILLLPLMFLVKIHLMSFWTGGNILKLIPGLIGVFIRRVWYRLSLEACGDNLFVDFLGVIRTKKARIGNDVYIGEKTIVGAVTIGDDTIIGHNCHLMSGKLQHGISRKKPIRLQLGKGIDPKKRIMVGKDCYICINVTVGANVADGTIVGANSFVNKTFKPNSIIGGCPAKFLKSRPA